MKDHLARHVLEQLVVDDPAAPVRPVMRVHVASCDRCSMRQRALDVARANYLVAYPPGDFAQHVMWRAAQPVPQPRRGLAALRPMWIWIGTALFIVLPVIVVLWLHAAPSDLWGASDDGPVRIVWQRGQSQRELSDGIELAAGDRVSAHYQFSHPRHLLVVGVDASGTVRRYFPVDASRTGPLTAGEQPLGIKVAGRHDHEQLFAIVADTPLDEVAIRTKLAAAMNRARASGAGLTGLASVELPGLQLRVWFRRP